MKPCASILLSTRSWCAPRPSSLHLSYPTQRAAISDIVVPRTLSAPSEDGQYVIPKGHTVVASPAFTQVDRKIWKNHAEWDPYRWIDPTGEAARALHEYLTGEKVDYGYGVVSKGTESVYQPFGAGRHRCIGEHVSSPLRTSYFYRRLTSPSVCFPPGRMHLGHSCPEPRVPARQNAPQRLQRELLTSTCDVASLTVCRQSLFVCPAGPCTVGYRRRATSRPQ